MSAAVSLLHHGACSALANLGTWLRPTTFWIVMSRGCSRICLACESSKRLPHGSLLSGQWHVHATSLAMELSMKMSLTHLPSKTTLMIMLSSTTSTQQDTKFLESPLSDRQAAWPTRIVGRWLDEAFPGERSLDGCCRHVQNSTRKDLVLLKAL